VYGGEKAKIDIPRLAILVEIWERKRIEVTLAI
jgi:hypothetical protein